MSEKTKRFWWLKLREDFFSQKSIKKLRRMAGGDTYTIIYLKMQLASLRNDGVILFENVEDSVEEELALQLDEEVDDVRMTLLFLEQQNLIEILNDREYVLPEAVRNIASECDSAARMRNMRERKREGASQCASLNVTCDTEIEKEIEIEKDITVSNDTVSSGDDERAHVDYKAVVDAFNKACISLPNVREINDRRRKAIRGAAQTVESFGGFAALFAKVEASDFLTGPRGRWTGCGIDWILKPANLTKILEGNYDNKADKPGQPDYTDASRYTERW